MDPPTSPQHGDVRDGRPVVLRTPAGEADEGPVAAPVQEALAVQVRPMAPDCLRQHRVPWGQHLALSGFVSGETV